MPSLHQLRTFVDIIDAGSVRAAAERQAVSQPAVSSALATLEREMGVALFERDGRGLRRSASGKALEGYARRILALLDQGVAETRATAAADAARLRVAAVTTAAEHVLPQAIGDFRRLEGAVEVELEVANRAAVWELLAHWRVELVVAGRPPHGQALTTLATRRNELVVEGASAMVGRPVADLARATWLLREPGSGTRSATEEFFELLGIAPPVLTIGSNGAIRECVRAGLGISLLAHDAIARDVADGHLATIATPLTPLARPWHLVASAERELSPGAARFAAYLRSYGDFLPPKARRYEHRQARGATKA